MLPVLVSYPDLSAEAQQTAQATFVASELASVERKLAAYRQQLTNRLLPLHERINDPYHISRLNNQLAFVGLLQRDGAALVRIIESNLCMFTPQGEYYRFMPCQ